MTVQAKQSYNGDSRSKTVGNGARIPDFTMTTHPDGRDDYSVRVHILGCWALLGVWPALVLVVTSFTRCGV
ncbi:flagellar biosynthetic protein FliP, partial [Vibrio parahaemolyticus]|nr:flagellar biosynthetic protein FliP [Vibrio parahaemolyticus]